uniref:HMG box domain-containing protein n=1 Tax=Lutzomyia longipalpis TaxID=7200 RepID=A0A1B0CQQ8_LUTLO
MSKIKCYRSGPITPNPFFNFLRTFRPQHCGKTIIEIAREGAKLWSSMTPLEKEQYYVQARTARPYRKRSQNSYYYDDDDDYETMFRPETAGQNFSNSTTIGQICDSHCRLQNMDKCFNWNILATFLFAISVIVFIFEIMNQ